MKDIIIAYPNKEVALRLRALLVGEGFRVSHICALGSSALGAAGEKDAGVIICASLLRDMGAGTLAEQLPADFDVVALAKNGKTEIALKGKIRTILLPSKLCRKLLKFATQKKPPPARSFAPKAASPCRDIKFGRK